MLIGLSQMRVVGSGCWERHTEPDTVGELRVMFISARFSNVVTLLTAATDGPGLQGPGRS
jgi:hypothetical protein